MSSIRLEDKTASGAKKKDEKTKVDVNDNKELVAGNLKIVLVDEPTKANILVLLAIDKYVKTYGLVMLKKIMESEMLKRISKSGKKSPLGFGLYSIGKNQELNEQDDVILNSKLCANPFPRDTLVRATDIRTFWAVYGEDVKQFCLKHVYSGILKM